MLGLLTSCGAALGYVVGLVIEDYLAETYRITMNSFQLTGLAFAAGAALFTALNVLGVGEAELRTSVGYQLTSCITPTVTAGLLLGALLEFDLSSRWPAASDQSTVLLMLIAAVAVGAGLAWLVANAAAYLLRGQVQQAVAVENLRST